MKKINNVSSDAVEKATGKNWDEWLKIIDKAEGKKKNHKEIVAFLKNNYKTSSWWQQMITVAYEHARGKRIVGETADAGFQLGIQKTIPLNQKDIWQLLVSEKGVEKWLGKTKVTFKQGDNFETEDGTSGEIRSVDQKQKIRLTMKPKNWKKSTTLQITLSSPRDTKYKTTVRFHHEKLPDKKTRDKMKKHWQDVLNELFY